MQRLNPTNNKENFHYLGESLYGYGCVESAGSFNKKGCRQACIRLVKTKLAAVYWSSTENNNNNAYNVNLNNGNVNNNNKNNNNRLRLVSAF